MKVQNIKCEIYTVTAACPYLAMMLYNNVHSLAQMPLIITLRYFLMCAKYQVSMVKSSGLNTIRGLSIF